MVFSTDCWEMGMKRFCLAICLILGIAHAGTVRADDASLMRFFGAYEGETVFQDREVAPRELAVVIRPFADGGFTIRWRTIIFDTVNEPRGRTQVIYFKPLDGQRAFFAATAPEDAAGLASQDPLDGRPFAWARISGETLTVNVFTISDMGDYVIQTYERQLTENGMALAFLKVRNGRPEQRMFGILGRVDN